MPTASRRYRGTRRSLTALAGRQVRWPSCTSTACAGGRTLSCIWAAPTPHPDATFAAGRTIVVTLAPAPRSPPCLLPPASCLLASCILSRVPSHARAHARAFVSSLGPKFTLLSRRRAASALAAHARRARVHAAATARRGRHAGRRVSLACPASIDAPHSSTRGPYLETLARPAMGWYEPLKCKS